MSRSSSLFGLLALAFVATACMADEEGLEGDYDVTEEDASGDDEFYQAAQDGKADGELTYLAVARLAKSAGLSCSYERIAIAVAVAKAESGFDPDITNTVGNAHGIDRGLWQINSYWHPNVTEACAFSPSCNARAMAGISNYGRKWSPWWTYKNGKHLPYMTKARAAQASVCGQ